MSRATETPPGRSAAEPVDGPPWGRPARRVLAVAFTVAFVQQALTVGLPLDRWRLLAWVAAAMAISCVGRPWRRARQLVLDWLPFVALLVAYLYSGGAADTLGMPLQVEAPLWVDRVLLVGWDPGPWLQDRLLPQGEATPVAWWEVGVTVVYVSHFVAPYVLAGVLWAKDRAAFVVYVWRFAIVTGLALASFVLLPTAPPWMAAQRGLLAPLERPVGRGWELIDFHSAEIWLDAGRAAANPVAAIPSLHAAYALLVAVTLWPRVRWIGWRVLLAAYPAAMGLVLVYGGEHYLIDLLLGWLCVLVAVVATDWWARRRRPVAS